VRGKALQFAQDEPCQLKTLTNFVNQEDGATPAFTCASNDLANNFGSGVLNNLTDIINNPGNAAKVQADVVEINRFRCCMSYPSSFHMSAGCAAY
jgi:hypothetical protein